MGRDYCHDCRGGSTIVGIREQTDDGTVRNGFQGICNHCHFGFHRLWPFLPGLVVLLHERDRARALAFFAGNDVVPDLRDLWAKAKNLEEELPMPDLWLSH